MPPILTAEEFTTEFIEPLLDRTVDPKGVIVCIQALIRDVRRDERRQALLDAAAKPEAKPEANHACPFCLGEGKRAGGYYTCCGMLTDHSDGQ